MAARPPADDDDHGSPSVFGIAAVDEHLSDADLSFPATPEEVAAATGDPDIPCGPNSHDVALSAALDRTGRRKFDSRTELLDELHGAFEHERHAGGGFVAWLRNLVGG